MVHIVNLYGKNTNKKLVKETPNKPQKNIITLIYNHLISYPTPSNLNYLWNFGSLAGVFLLIQIISGIFLAMHYTSNIEGAFNSIENIMRNINNGWFLRYIHSNGASMFFIVVYLHIARGLYYKSFKYESRTIWYSGLIILILMMATAFIGYVLPWGQMSYWGATVITNIFSAIPIVGPSFVNWLWGGFSVGAATLSRFFSFHYVLPFIIVFAVILHLSELHNIGSTNPFPHNGQFTIHNIFFYPYFVIKDILGLILFLIFYSYFIFFYPNYLGHSDNYIEANPLVTPAHIIPEWYFLPFYAILRSIPSKIGGIVFMFGAILIFFTMPHVNKFFKFWSDFITTVSTPNMPSMGLLRVRLLKSERKKMLAVIKKREKRLYYKLIFEKFVVSLIYYLFISLGWLGSMPVTEPYTTIGLIYSLSFFVVVYFYTIIAK